MIRKRERSGFTLIELLLSALILSIILVGFTSLFHYANLAWKQTITTQDKNISFFDALDLVSTEFRSAIPPYIAQPGLGMRAYDAADVTTPQINQTGKQFDLIQFHCTGYNSAEGQSGSGSDGIGSDIIKRSYFGKWSGTGTDTRLIGAEEGGKRSQPIPTIPYSMSALEDIVYKMDGLDFFYYPNINSSLASCYDRWNTATSKGLPQFVIVKMTSNRNDEKLVVAVGVHPYARDTYISR